MKVAADSNKCTEHWPNKLSKKLKTVSSSELNMPQTERFKPNKYTNNKKRHGKAALL